MNELFAAATERSIVAEAKLDSVIAEVRASLSTPFVPREFEDLEGFTREQINARIKEGTKKQKLLKKEHAALYRKGLQAIKDAQAEANLAAAQVRALR